MMQKKSLRNLDEKDAFEKHECKDGRGAAFEVVNVQKQALV